MVSFFCKEEVQYYIENQLAMILVIGTQKAPLKCQRGLLKIPCGKIRFDMV